MVKADPESLSMGEICSETGLSADVVRVWERRYGFPVPLRLPSGHRRYRRDDLHRLRLMAQALAHGHRPAAVVRATDGALREMLLPGDTAQVGSLFQAVVAMDASAMRQLFTEAHTQMDWKSFLDRVVSPLLDRVGMAWAEGTIGVEHEHLATEVMEDLLRELRTGFSGRPEGGSVLLCTLPGERHRLGLLMAGLAYAAHGLRTELLGVDLPVASIAQAAHLLQVDRVAVSISVQTAGEPTRQLLLLLQERLPPGCRLIIGGKGVARTRRIQGVERRVGLEVD